MKNIIQKLEILPTQMCYLSGLSQERIWGTKK